MRLTLTILGLEAYALVLAWMQALGGVRTDEAKYLLNIPYPHPPLARWVMSLTEGLAFQEMFWRVVLATLLVQAVWIIWDAAKKLETYERLTACGMWLLSGGVILQAGSIMMAPLTALQALFFLWLLLRERSSDHWAGFIAIFWLASLFTAYQIVLFLPIVFMLFWRMRIPLWKKAGFVCVPLLLLAIYSLSNPLTLASVVLAGTMNATAGFNLLESLGRATTLWMLSGSVLLSIAGTIAMRGRKQWPLFLSLVLVLLYIVLSYRAYYGILFVPLLAMAFTQAPFLLRGRKAHPTFVVTMILMAVLAIVIVQDSGWPSSPGAARSTLSKISPAQYGDILIAGSFGHDWQYASRWPVRRYRPDLLSQAQAVICLEPCEGIRDAGEFVRLEDVPVEAWVRL